MGGSRQQRRGRVFVFVVLLLLAGSGCKPQARAPVKIGLAINLSGLGGTAGEYIRDGALLAVEEVNSRGGIHGQPLMLLVEDDLNTPEGILAADTKLIEQGVVAIIGHSFSENTLVAYPLVTSRNVLLFTPYTATTKLSDLDDLFCRTSVDNKLYGAAIAELFRKRGFSRVAFVLDMANQSFVEDLLAQAAPRFDGAIELVRIDSGKNVEWDSVLGQLLVNDPQAVVLLTEVTMTGLGAQKLRGRGYQGELIASLWAQTPDLWRYGSESVGGMTLFTYIDPQNNRVAARAFARRMQERFNRPANARSVRAYEAIQILAQALRHCSPPPTATELKEVLVRTHFETIVGPVDFNATCDVVRPIYEVRVGDKEFFSVGEIRIRQNGE